MNVWDWLATSSSTTEAKFLSDRIDFKNNNYLVNIPNNQLYFPFTLEECIENLKKIQKEKYLDIKKHHHLMIFLIQQLLNIL